MKILFDANLSYRVVRELKQIWPDCRSAAELGLGKAADPVIWNYAKAENYIIATYDEDYLDLLALRGAPPKIIYLRLQNASRTELLAAFQRNSPGLMGFAQTEDIDVYFLF